MSEQNSLCFPCLEKVRTKFPVFPVPWPPCRCTLIFPGFPGRVGTLVFTPACHSVHGGWGGVSVWGVSVKGESLSGGDLCQGDPPYDKEQAVRILLQCILVAIAIEILIHSIEKNHNHPRNRNSSTTVIVDVNGPLMAK